MAKSNPGEDFSLKELVEEVSVELVEDRRKQIGGLVKVQLQRYEQLVKDVKSLENQLKKKKKKLEKSTVNLEKLRKGDWSVLTMENKQSEKED
jgi:hypothetical protein